MMPSALTSTAAAVGRAKTPQLRGYQRDVRDQVCRAWASGIDNVLAVLPTGAGKTILLAEIVHNHVGASCVIAHRQELVSQISVALARAGVRHRIIAPPPTRLAIMSAHLEEVGHCWIDPTAQVAVAGVDTLKNRVDAERRFLAQVTLWVQDEAHHVLKGNKWGKVVKLFPNAKGLGVTATPLRADGKGLGLKADGVFQAMVVGPGMRDLIDWGFLTDYRIVGAQTHIANLEDAISKTTGDYVLDRGKGKEAVRASSLVGDVVAQYQKWAAGKLAVVFTSDLDTARDMVVRFKRAGVLCEMVDGKTPDDLRRSILRRFRRRELNVLVNVDLFGEGFDLPAIEVVIMARPTKSFALYTQQFGRALRLMIPPEWMALWDQYSPAQRLQLIAQSGKPKALIIDHVGNVAHFRGPPDALTGYTAWTLDAAEKGSRGAGDAMPLTYCTNATCGAPYERFRTRCPECGHKPEPGDSRGGPAAVDGDLFEFDAEMLASLRNLAAQVMQPLETFRAQQSANGTPQAWTLSHVKHKAEHQQTARVLLDAMAWWAGERRAVGETDAELFKRFFLTFGVDWVTAQGLDRPAMAALITRIDEKLTAPSSAARLQA